MGMSPTMSNFLRILRYKEKLWKAQVKIMSVFWGGIGFGFGMATAVIIFITTK